MGLAIWVWLSFWSVIVCVLCTLAPTYVQGTIVGVNIRGGCRYGQGPWSPQGHISGSARPPKSSGSGIEDEALRI